MTYDQDLADDIGQMLIGGFKTLEPDDSVRELIEKYRVGTLILFARNIKDPEQLLKLTRSLQQIAKDAGHKQPLLLTIDQECGVVSRIPGTAAPTFPGAMSQGATERLGVTNRVYSLVGKYLTFYGFYGNYAPVADVNSNPKNPVINVRSFGDDPEKVSQFAYVCAEATKNSGLLPCMKHFPGHGDTSTDSHYGTARVDRSMEELEKTELIPFRKGIREKVGSIMMAHIVVPAMGDDLPASISASNYKFLQEKLCYDGYVVTDCLEMDAISKTVGTDEGARMAFEAGADSVMMCHTLERQAGAFNKMYESVQQGKRSRESVKKSVCKLRAIKDQLMTWDEVLKEKTESDLNRDQMAKDTAEMNALYEQSVTVARGSPSDYIIKPEQKIAVVYISVSDAKYQNGAVQDPSKSIIPRTYFDALKAANVQYEEFSYLPDTPVEKNDDAIKKCDKILLLVMNVNSNKSQATLAHHIATLGKTLVTVATYIPYDFLESKYASEFPTYICQYEPAVAAFKAVIKILTGKIPPKGKLPIHVD